MEGPSKPLRSVGRMRILLVSQMYPGPDAPDLGVFVRGLEEQLLARGHDVERAVLDRRRRGKRKYLELARTTRQTARRFYAYRDRCFNKACIGDAYVGRMREIRDIMEGRWRPRR